MSGDPHRPPLDGWPPALPPAGAKERSWARLAALPRKNESRRPWRWAAVAVLATLVGIGIWSGTRSGHHAPRLSPLRITWSAGETAAAHLSAGALIDTRDREALVGDGQTFLAWIAPASRARVERRGDLVILRLGRGEVRVWSAPRPSTEPLEVATATHRVRVVGTVFTVRSSPGGDAVWVGRGKVEVRGPRGAFARLSAGARWSSGQEPARSLDPSQVAWLAHSGAEGRAALQGAWSAPGRPPVTARAQPTASLRPSPLTPSAAMAADHEAATASPRARSAAPSPTRDTQAALAPSSSGRDVPEPAPAPTASSPTEVVLPPSEPEAEVPPAATPPTNPEDDAAQHATELERQGLTTDALAAYRRIAQGSGPAAEFALYRAGRLQMRRQHDLGGALSTWRHARTRYPAGALRQEIDLSILDALVRTNRRAEAAAEASAFLRRWPGSERRTQVEAIRSRMQEAVEESP